MRKYLIYATLLILLYFTIAFFYNKTFLILKKSSFSKVTEIDTIESYPERGIYILGLVRPGFLGKFSYNLAITKCDNKNPDHLTQYEIEKNRRMFRVSNEFISFVSDNSSWGWFYISKGKFQDSLPGMNFFRDSLRSVYGKDIFVRKSNGFIDLFKNGKIIKSLNYGNLISKNKNLNFDNIKYDLYKLIEDSVTLFSGNIDDIFKQKEGIYFIPSPGYGLIKKFNKKEILDAVDSIFINNSNSNKIRFKEVQ